MQSAADGLDLRLVRGDYGDGFDGGEHAVEPLRLCLLRFLRGNSFSVSGALSQVTMWNCLACARARSFVPASASICTPLVDLVFPVASCAYRPRGCVAVLYSCVWPLLYCLRSCLWCLLPGGSTPTFLS